MFSSSLLLGCDHQHSRLTTADAHPGRIISYTPYGHSIPQKDLACIGYTGLPLERTTACYMAGHGRRAFNPSLMRFNSPDRLSPFGKGGINCYVYCGGDPINWHDRSGQTRGRFSGSTVSLEDSGDSSFFDRVMSLFKFKYDELKGELREVKMLIDKSEAFLDGSKGAENEFDNDRLTILGQVADFQVVRFDISSEMTKIEKNMSEVGRYIKFKVLGKFSELPVRDKKVETAVAEIDGGKSYEPQGGRKRVGTWPSSELIRGSRVVRELT